MKSKHLLKKSGIQILEFKNIQRHEIIIKPIIYCNFSFIKLL